MPSTAIRQISYDPAAKRLAVTFVTGRHYLYEDVPPEVYRAFRASSSKGAFFNSRIRDQYRYRELTDTHNHTHRRSA
jgi:lysyl-tRNA synthetase class 2